MIGSEPAGIDEVNRAQLLDWLQIALELELATLPPYLVALLSIRDSANREAAKLIRSVAVEEMLHLALVANVINAVGGSPHINRDALATYPLTMTFKGEAFADRRFPIALAPFSQAAITTFMKIEQPNRQQLQLEKFEIEVPAPTIGEFYGKIVALLRRLALEDAISLFSGDPTRQLESDFYWSSGGKIVVVHDLETAEEALTMVIEQGEGAWPKSETVMGDSVDHYQSMGHYFRFAEIFHQKHFVAGDDPQGAPSGSPVMIDYAAVLPIKTSPQSGDYATGTEAARINTEFNRQFTAMLKQLNEAFNGQPKTLYTAIMDGMHEISSLALDLMNTPIEGDPNGTTGCPTFEWTE